MKKHTLNSLFSGALLAMVCSSAIHAQTITTIAGTGVSGFSGDGGSALMAQFADPSGVATDPAGNIYVSDQANHRVRKIAYGTGIISTFAGTGGFGLTGLGGPAASAGLEYPDGVFSNAAGDILITDYYADATLWVDHTTGILASRCGNGTQGSDGDGGPGNMARMMLPKGSCEDPAGNTYIADMGARIRKIAAVTHLTSTLVSAPVNGLFFDPTSASDLYFSSGNSIKKIDVTTGAIITVVGTGAAGYSGNGGYAASATLSNPGNIFIDGHKNLYICDRGNHAVRQVNLLTGIIWGIAGNGSMGFSGDGGFAPYSRLNDPEGVWVDNMSNIYIADAGNNRIRRISPKSASGGSSSSPKALHGVEAAYASNEEVMVYPNPSNGIFTLQAGAAQNGAPVNVYNILGQIVYNTTVTDVKNTIDLSSQAAGVYTLMMRSSTGTYTQKLTKQ